MQRSHKIRIYPTREQEVQLSKTAGTARYVYNWALDLWKRMYEDFDKGLSDERPNAYAVSRKWTQERPDWSREVAQCSQKQAILNVNKAFSNLWKGKSAYPAFHKKGRKDSFYVSNDKAYIKDMRISLPKIGKVRMAEPLRYEGKIMSYTVSGYAGQWFVSVQVETPNDERPTCLNPDSVVGIDVGLKHVATASDGTVLDLPPSLKRLDEHMKALQRKLSKKAKRSRNHAKALRRKQKIQQRINNIRQDVVHKFTAAIAKNHGVVAVEDLDIRGMMDKAAAPLRRCLSTSMMREVIRQLEYKSQKLVKVDRYYPSTKRCSQCGNVKEHVGLDERTYTCEACGLVLDRDYNASLNIMQAGAVSSGVPVEASPRG